MQTAPRILVVDQANNEHEIAVDGLPDEPVISANVWLPGEPEPRPTRLWRTWAHPAARELPVYVIVRR